MPAGVTAQGGGGAVGCGWDTDGIFCALRWSLTPFIVPLAAWSPAFSDVAPEEDTTVLLSPSCVPSLHPLHSGSECLP